MQAYYTIIKIAPNPITGDSIAIGLLLHNDRKYFIRFSDEKKSAARRLLGDKSEVVDFVVKQIISFINKTNHPIDSSDNPLFPLANMLNSDYFNYLNSYSNGILQFSKPSFLNQKHITPEDFSNLYSLIIDRNAPHIVTKDISIDRFVSTVEEKLISRVSNKIHTNININSSYVQGMYFQYEMDCIGLNGSFVGAKSILFNRSIPIIDKDISHYISLISLLSSTYKKELKTNDFYLIAEEPDSNTPEHKTYSEIIKNPLFTVVHPEQADTIANVVEKSNAKTFLEQPTA